MKMRILLLTLASIIVLPLHIAKAQDANKMVTVNVSRLFNAYYRTDEVKKEFEAYMEKIKAENLKRANVIQEEVKKLQAMKDKMDDPNISEENRTKLTIEYNQLANQIRALDNQRRAYIGRRSRAMDLDRKEAMGKIIEELQEIIQNHAKEKDYDFVLNKTGQSGSRVAITVYTKDNTDITGDLLKVLEDLAEKAKPE